MNKPLLIVLLVIAVGLVVYLATRGEVDTRAPVDESLSENKPEPYAACQGTKTDQEPAFDVQVTAIRSGGQNRIEFTVTELSGLCVQNVYVEVWHGVRNAETGELEPPGPDTYMLKHLLKGVVPAGGPIVDSIVLNRNEMGELNWDDLESEDLAARVYQWGDVVKPE